MSNTQNELSNIILKALSSNTYESIYFKDLDSKFLFISQYHLDYFGLSSLDEYVGTSDFDYFTKEHAQKAFNDEQEIIRTGKPIISKIEQETWAGELVSYVITSKYPLYDEQNNIIGTWGHSSNLEMTSNNTGEIKHQKLKKELSNTEIIDDSRIDPLTKLKNTKAFYETMNLFYQDAMNSMNIPNKQHILLLVDMNDFKSLNNSYGHKYGDKALAFASKLIQTVESKDTHLFRYGGDEFAILIDHSSYESAIILAKSIIELFDKNKFISNSDEITLTVSVGMSRFKESLPFGNIHDIINLTDKRLYAAKKVNESTLIHDNSYRL